MTVSVTVSLLNAGCTDFPVYRDIEHELGAGGIMGAVHTATGSYAAYTVTTYCHTNAASNPEQSLLDARRPPGQAKNKNGKMLLGNGKNFLYDTACCATPPGEDDCEQVENEFLRHVCNFAESPRAQRVVSANKHLRIGIQLTILEEAEQYIETVELCHIIARKKTTASCPDCGKKFTFKWDTKTAKMQGRDQHIRNRLRKHFTICEPAAGAQLSGAFKKASSTHNKKMSKARAEQVGRTYHEGRGNGDRYDALQPFMESFEKSQLEVIIKCAQPIVSRMRLARLACTHAYHLRIAQCLVETGRLSVALLAKLRLKRISCRSAPKR
eukprot:COSAG03_NODE_1792_length_3518_cov_11.157063_5_plen_326_part_00